MEFAGSQDAPYQRDRAQSQAQDGAGVQAVGSMADLFPKIVTMQRLCGGAAFAVLAAQARTPLSSGRLECRMQSAGSEKLVDALLEDQAAFLLAHLHASPRPLILAPLGSCPPEASPAVTVQTETDGGILLALPVQLGAMGNGYVVFFDVRNTISNDLLVDLHRKSLSVMRERLRLAFGISSDAEKLNEREIECLQLVGNGMKSEAIGDRLNLSVHTVNAYLGSATTKLNAVNRIQAIAKAIRLGIIA